jgi:two-component sensor histidine kinase
MVDVLWMMVIGLYTFFMLGKAWGVFILMLNLAGIILFLFLRLNENLPLIGQLEDGKIMALAFNFLICMKLIIFLILQFLNVIKKAENDLRAVNKELVDQNNTIISQNQEKTVMLREIHHRVKNNLQVITSLLRLQSMEIEDSESKTKFNETIDRVRSIASIHERMYLSENLSKIDLEGYINSLAEDLIQSYRVKKSIALEVECELHHIHPKSLVSVALIFNELISNSLKHAFPTVENPEIQILIKLQDNDVVMIHYRDNGKWKEQSKKSFGLELIDSLTEQLNGSLSLQKENGTHFYFQFDQKSIVEDDQ